MVYGDNTLEHIAIHNVTLSEVQNILKGYFIPIKTYINGTLRYSVIGESHGRILTVILEPTASDELLLITAFDVNETYKII